MPLFVTIVLDGVGIGSQLDADLYGDDGANTLYHVLERERPSLPNLTAAGLGNIQALPGIESVRNPTSSYGMMTERSAGKDSTTGHWELAGIQLAEPFPTYPNGFPDSLIKRFITETGAPGYLGNKAASGTEIIDELGVEHVRSGRPIVYTSADSVFQIAAHKDVIALDDLYHMCSVVRDQVCVGEHGVGRVIARPFIGAEGEYSRVSSERKDFSYLPDSPPVQSVLQEAGIQTVSIGKISDLFGGIGFDVATKTSSNADGIDKTIEAMRRLKNKSAFIWTNLVDFDQEYGHRNDHQGFAKALEQFDRALPDIVDSLPRGGILVLTADHGNDPTFPGTDHTREHVPLLVFSDGYGRGIGHRSTFADHAASVLDYFGVIARAIDGISFL